MTAPVTPAAEARDRLIEAVGRIINPLVWDYAGRDPVRREDRTHALSRAVQIVDGPLATALAESTARTDEARADRATLTKALTELTCGGSEFFVRRGEDFIADAPACVEHVRNRIQRAHERAVAAVRQANAATARIAALEAALEPFAAAADAYPVSPNARREGRRQHEVVWSCGVEEKGDRRQITVADLRAARATLTALIAEGGRDADA